MINAVKKFTFDEAEFDEREILRYSGSRGNDGNEIRLLRDAIELSRPVIQYEGVYTVFDLSISDNLCDFGFAKVESSSLSATLRDCSKVALIGATAGIELDRLIKRQISIGRHSLAHMLSAIGAERVEYICDMLCEEIGKIHGAHTPRFSPGYGDLPISFQREVFSALDLPRTLGISLSGEFIMSPSKSVTAIVGIK